MCMCFHFKMCVAVLTNPLIQDADIKLLMSLSCLFLCFELFSS